jgi:hypothetical protein
LYRGASEVEEDLPGALVSWAITPAARNENMSEGNARKRTDLAQNNRFMVCAERCKPFFVFGQTFYWKYAGRAWGVQIDFAHPRI